ncbi:unnamed protein product [Ceratitis capitata]|uniref:(Mediterranean fruit fly) hypothetical protein n=1 Tax=Ceratitis capitata TaxID=7213 RepID=A0A811UMN3_CERCA|nr:unnamed protein product [Ceratitis capitata]
MHLKSNEFDPFLKQITTGSWSKHANAPQLTSKADIHEKKSMLSVCWDWKDVVYSQLLPRNQTINSVVYCEQLDKLNTFVNEKRPVLIYHKGVIFHQGNARLHTTLATCHKLRELGWELLMHPS